MRNLTVAILGIFLVSAGGCAKLIRGEEQTMKFETEPQGALVKVGDKQLTTPVETKLKRKEKYDVTVSKPGYQTVTFEMVANWDGVSMLSAPLPGGSLMLATDTATGADRAFYALEKIVLQPSTDPNAPPVKLVQYRGKLYTEAGYKKVMDEEKKYREWYFEN